MVSAHERGEIHYHDLDYSPFFPMFNCMLIDLKGMLTQGFKMGNAEIEPPKSISTATAVTAQIIAQVASHIYGGTTINRIDEVLAPFVTESFNKHRKTAEEWQIPDADGYAAPAPRKSATTRSSLWNMKSTRCIPPRPDAVRYLRFWPRHQLGVASDPAVDSA
ncbi:anaerobic ribonucleoside-triphosphate reductase [Enterobacter cancerogenus]|uniref:Anaerobic ribonucleoside-triphosphate reductase n=1 Tax=Enterobacter cancerogenus TaxID=69218 RepID=A0A484XWG6_9ENTR|nr:anaerobic ribonucleoside-triphosphate reductase [Enterobacter cancerogenus]